MHAYGAVKGMCHPVFWLSHAAPEGGDRDDLASKNNEYEAQMATRLARYLVQNGYGAGARCRCCCGMEGTLCRGAAVALQPAQRWSPQVHPFMP